MPLASKEVAMTKEKEENKKVDDGKLGYESRNLFVSRSRIRSRPDP